MLIPVRDLYPDATVRDTLKGNSHAHYEYFRTYFAGSGDAVASRMNDLKLIVGGDEFNADSDGIDTVDEDEDVAAVLSSQTVPTAATVPATASSPATTSAASESEPSPNVAEKEGAVEKLVAAVLASENEVRLQALANLMRDHLCEYELSTYVYAAKMEVVAARC